MASEISIHSRLVQNAAHGDGDDHDDHDENSDHSDDEKQGTYLSNLGCNNSAFCILNVKNHTSQFFPQNKQ